MHGKAQGAVGVVGTIDAENDCKVREEEEEEEMVLVSSICAGICLCSTLLTVIVGSDDRL